jgi:dihydroflavonol-4-reductase
VPNDFERANVLHSNDLSCQLRGAKLATHGRSDGMGKIAVTGAARHLGCVLVRALLEDGHTVRAVVRSTQRPLSGIACQLVKADVRDPASLDLAFDGMDVVFHLAALISMQGKAEEKALFDINVVGTQNVIDAVARARVSRLIHFSSIQAFDRRTPGCVIDETSASATDRHPAYDRSKVQADRVVHEAVNQGLDAVILHPTAVIGPHDHGPSRMGQIFTMLLAGRLPALLDAECDFVDVRDVAQAGILAIKSGAAGEHYIVGGHLRTIRELAIEVQKESRRRVPPFDIPRWLSRFVAPFFEAWGQARGVRPLFTGESLDALFANHHVSTAKAARELGYAARPFQETVHDTCTWFKHESAVDRESSGHQGEVL